MLECKTKKFIKLLQWAGTGLFLVLLICSLLFVKEKADLYQKACAQMEAGDYSDALDNLKLLDKYPLAEPKIEICEQYLSAYEHARELYDNQDYQKAFDEFLLLGEAEDSPEMAELCRQYLLQEKAAERMERYRKFLTEQMPWCDNQLLFRDFKEHVEQKDYSDLHTDRIDRTYLTDAQNNLISQVETYLLAVKTKATGDNAGAFDLFGKIPTFDDAKELRDSCLIPKPETGILFQNPYYYSSECILTIANGSTPGKDEERSLGDGYVEIYTADDATHVCSLYIREQESVSVDIPAGSYKIRGAFGQKWFGQEGGLFGSSGEEYTYKSDEGSDIYELKAYYQDTITIHGRYKIKR